MEHGCASNVGPCGSGGAQDKTIINRIMLRFRPIAPKPVAGASRSSSSGTENKSKVLLSEKRAKRKYVRVRRNGGYKRKNSSKYSEELEKRDGLEHAVVTLQLMPEKTESAEGSVAGVSWCKSVDLDLTVDKIEIQDKPSKPPSLLTLPPENMDRSDERLDRRARTAVVESWVTAESVTDTCMEVGGLLGRTDIEKVKNLERDTCPGFISDGLNMVRWVNEAYKKMVSKSKQTEEIQPEIRVWLKLKNDELVRYPPNRPAFTCKVRLQYTTWEKKKCTKMVPCDVWRLDCGGFAWRLDMKAALSLGL